MTFVRNKRTGETGYILQPYIFPMQCGWAGENRVAVDLRANGACTSQYDIHYWPKEDIEYPECQN